MMDKPAKDEVAHIRGLSDRIAEILGGTHPAPALTALTVVCAAVIFAAQPENRRRVSREFFRQVENDLADLVETKQ